VERQRVSGWRLKLFLRVLIFVLALLPPAIVVIEVARHQVDVPFWDQWNFVPLLGKSFEQGITPADLWQLHNEHRLFFPRLIMLGLAQGSGYNIAYELAVSIILAAAILALVWLQGLRVTRALEPKGLPWFIPVFSLLVFSLNQGENWVWGWQLQIFLNVASVVLGFTVLAGAEFAWKRFGLAVLLGIIATYSFANGLIYWILGFAGLLFLPFRVRKEKSLALAGWAAATGAVLFSYFWKFHPNSPSGKPWDYFLQRPADYLAYILKYLGAVIINYEDYALAFGLLGLVLFAALTIAVLRKGKEERCPLLPFLLFGLYALGCAMLTGIGRVGLGTFQAMSYRYVTFSNLIWIADFLFLYVLSQEIRKRSKSRLGRRFSFAALVVFVFVLLFGIGRTSYRVGHRVLKTYHARLSPARAELRRGENEELLLRLYIDADDVRQGIEILKKHNLSVFRYPVRKERSSLR
jgi:hypothetical protein